MSVAIWHIGFLSIHLSWESFLVSLFYQILKTWTQHQWEFSPRALPERQSLAVPVLASSASAAFSRASRRVCKASPLHSCRAIPGGWSCASWQHPGRKETSTLIAQGALTALWLSSAHTPAAGLTQALGGRQWAGSPEVWAVFEIGCTLQLDLNGMSSICISPGTQQGMD